MIHTFFLISSWADTVIWIGLLASQLPALARMARSTSLQFDAVHGVVLLFGFYRFGFAIIRWAFGSHQDVMADPERVSRAIVYAFGTVAAILIWRIGNALDERGRKLLERDQASVSRSS